MPKRKITSRKQKKPTRATNLKSVGTKPILRNNATNPRLRNIGTNPNASLNDVATDTNDRSNLENVATGGIMQNLASPGNLIQPIGIEDNLPQSIANRLNISSKEPIYTPDKKIVMRRRRINKKEPKSNMLGNIAKFGLGAAALGGGLYAANSLLGGAPLGEQIGKKIVDLGASVLHGRANVINKKYKTYWQTIAKSLKDAYTTLNFNDAPLIEKLAAYLCLVKNKKTDLDTNVFRTLINQAKDLIYNYAYKDTNSYHTYSFDIDLKDINGHLDSFDQFRNNGKEDNALTSLTGIERPLEDMINGILRLENENYPV